MHEECYYCLRRNEIFMLLYHGTTRKRGKSIVEDKCIKHDAELLYKDTTPGYIYCTNDILYAIYYGNKNSLCHKEESFYVFRFNLDENKLEPDEDEVRMVGMDNPENYSKAQETLEDYKSARYEENIYEFEYAILPTVSNVGKEDEKLISECVEVHGYNHKSSNEYMKKHISDLIVKLNRITNWEKIS